MNKDLDINIETNHVFRNSLGLVGVAIFFVLAYVIYQYEINKYKPVIVPYLEDSGKELLRDEKAIEKINAINSFINNSKVELDQNSTEQKSRQIDSFN